MHKRVTIIYLCWSDEPQKYLPEVLNQVKKQSYPKKLLDFLIVYNNHKKDGRSSLPYIEQLVTQHKDELPRTTILAQKENFGFVKGNNIGMQWAIDNNSDYVFLHNADGVLDEKAIEELVGSMEKDEKIGAVQSLVLLDNERDLINSAGNNYHYLGFGYCNLYRKNKELVDNMVQEVGYISGAAVMMSVDLLKKFGLWDEYLLFYHDDLEYSFRLHLQNYKTMMNAKSIFYHKYQFSRNSEKFFLMERNRFAILISYYKLSTLLIVFPMMLIVEIGIIIYALKSGWLKQKLSSYAYWLSFDNWKLWLKKRKILQSNRKITDKQLLSKAVGCIEFEDIDNIVLHYIANPLMKLYWFIVKKIIFW